MGDVARAPDRPELDAMKQLVAGAMCAGATGFSTGLFYAPQSFATTEEVIALAREAGQRHRRVLAEPVWRNHVKWRSSRTQRMSSTPAAVRVPQTRIGEVVDVPRVVFSVDEERNLCVNQSVSRERSDN